MISIRLRGIQNYSDMKRYGSVIRVRPEKLEEYKKLHAEVWPGVRRMIAECGEGGADLCSSSPGWTGHMAFIDPVDEFMNVQNMDEYLQQEARIVTLHPLTVAQNSLHGVFGQSGYIQDVPPKAATIGPVDVLRARERIEVHSLLTNNTFSSWQRMTSRLVLHGPVCPQVPSSMLQLMKTLVLVSEEIAAPFECWEKVGY